MVDYLVYHIRNTSQLWSWDLSSSQGEWQFSHDWPHALASEQKNWTSALFFDMSNSLPSNIPTCLVFMAWVVKRCFDNSAKKSERQNTRKNWCVRASFQKLKVKWVRTAIFEFTCNHKATGRLFDGRENTTCSPKFPTVGKRPPEPTEEGNLRSLHKPWAKSGRKNVQTHGQLFNGRALANKFCRIISNTSNSTAKIQLPITLILEHAVGKPKIANNVRVGVLQDSHENNT